MKKREPIVPGQVYGGLRAVERLPGAKEETWQCECLQCGGTTTATKSHLHKGSRISCGCAKHKPPKNTLDLKGKTINSIRIVEQVGITPRGNTLWQCECHCGELFTGMGTSIRRGDIVSCGCLKSEQVERARQVMQEEMAVDGVSIPFLTKAVSPNSKTGVKGVHKRIRGGRVTYEASLTIRGRRIYAAPQPTLEQAAAERKRLEDLHHKPLIDAYNNNRISKEPN